MAKLVSQNAYYFVILKVNEKTWISVLVTNTGIQDAENVLVHINDSEVNLYNALVDVPAQNTKLINISWKPSEEGEHTIVASTPDDSKAQKVEVDPGFEKERWDGLKKKIAEDLIAALSIKSKIELVEFESLPRATGKAKRVIDLRKESA